MSDSRWFVDTNVLVYVFDGRDRVKQSIARGLFAADSGELVLSAQVLSEFFSVVTGKIRALTPEQARRAARHFGRLVVWPTHRDLVLRATRLTEASRLSHWDALIVETAIEAGAGLLLTEDLQHGQSFGPVRVVNPFRSD